MLFSPGDLVVVRDVSRSGEVHRVIPFNVVEDTLSMTVLFAPGGTRHFSGVPVDPNYTGPWMLTEWVPGEGTLSQDSLRFLFSDTWYSIHFRWGYGPWQWYVNFERAYARREFGFDTCDLELDITVQPDRSWAWKDLAEYDEARGLGLITTDEHENITNAATEVLHRITNRAEPFTDRWVDWKPDSAWRQPELPTDHLIVPGQSSS